MTNFYPVKTKESASSVDEMKKPSESSLSFIRQFARVITALPGVNVNEGLLIVN